jgi:hypothetical protein
MKNNVNKKVIQNYKLHHLKTGQNSLMQRNDNSTEVVTPTITSKYLLLFGAHTPMN